MPKSSTPSSSIFTFLRLFSWIVMTLMVLAMLYMGWLSLTNWQDIRV